MGEITLIFGRRPEEFLSAHWNQDSGRNYTFFGLQSKKSAGKESQLWMIISPSSRGASYCRYVRWKALDLYFQRNKNYWKIFLRKECGTFFLTGNPNCKKKTCTSSQNPIFSELLVTQFLKQPCTNPAHTEVRIGELWGFMRHRKPKVTAPLYYQWIRLIFPEETGKRFVEKGHNNPNEQTKVQWEIELPITINDTRLERLSSRDCDCEYESKGSEMEERMDRLIREFLLITNARLHRYPRSFPEWISYRHICL